MSVFPGWGTSNYFSLESIFLLGKNRTGIRYSGFAVGVFEEFVGCTVILLFGALPSLLQWKIPIHIPYFDPLLLKIKPQGEIVERILSNNYYQTLFSENCNYLKDKISYPYQNRLSLPYSIKDMDEYRYHHEEIKKKLLCVIYLTIRWLQMKKQP